MENKAQSYELLLFLQLLWPQNLNPLKLSEILKTPKQGYHFRNDKKCQKSDLKLTSKLILIFVKLQISFTTEKEKKLSEVTLSPDAFFYMEELYLFIGFKKDIYIIGLKSIYIFVFVVRGYLATELF